MITDPFELRRICLMDWNNKIIGQVVLPTFVEDARAYVNFFSEVNLVHPELRALYDPWAEERAAKYAAALRDWPRNRIYPEEAWYFVQEEAERGRLVIRHSLRYLPAERTRSRPPYRPYRPQKGGAKKWPRIRLL